MIFKFVYDTIKLLKLLYDVIKITSPKARHQNGVPFFFHFQDPPLAKSWLLKLITVPH